MKPTYKPSDEPSLLKKIWTSTRAFSLTATATPGIVVLLTGLGLEHWNADFTSFGLSMVAVLLLQISVNLFNDVYDHWRGVDQLGDIGGSGVIQKNWLSPKFLYRFAQVCVTLSFFVALPILIQYPIFLGSIALFTFVGAMGYSGLGIGFKYRAWGDFVVFALCGPLLTLGFSVAIFGQVSRSILVVGTILGLGAVGILHANNLNDLEIDASRGARTIANQIGFRRSQVYLKWIYFGMACTAILSIVLFQLPGWFALAPGLAIGFVVPLLRKVKKASGPLSPSIAMIRVEAAKIHFLLGAAWVLVFTMKFALLASFFFTTSAHAATRLPDPEVVAQVDLARYSGLWYEIAHSPNFFQRKCGSSTAKYEVLDVRSLSVFNTCYQANDKITHISGVAKIVDLSVPAKLRVKFNFFARGDYWITELDSDYKWAVVSSPGKRFTFILSRTPTLDTQIQLNLLSTLKEKGYPTDRFIFDQRP